jgi:hypothetical protein
VSGKSSARSGDEWLKAMRVFDTVCDGLQMESRLVGELLTNAGRWVGRLVGVGEAGVEDRPFARAEWESLKRIRFAVGLNTVFDGMQMGSGLLWEPLATSRRSLIRHLVGDLKAGEDRIFGRAGEESLKRLCFAVGLDTVTLGVQMGSRLL